MGKIMLGMIYSFSLQKHSNFGDLFNSIGLEAANGMRGLSPTVFFSKWDKDEYSECIWTKL